MGDWYLIKWASLNKSTFQCSARAITVVLSCTAFILNDLWSIKHGEFNWKLNKLLIYRKPSHLSKCCLTALLWVQSFSTVPWLFNLFYQVFLVIITLLEICINSWSRVVPLVGYWYLWVCLSLSVSLTWSM